VESSTLVVDASEFELSAADNVSLATSGADDSWLASLVDVDSSCRLQVPASVGPATVTPATAHDRSTDVDDFSEDDQGMSNHLSLLSLVA